ncbi:MAG: hypothetical protein MRY57_04135 [Candidatus Pacebacteria bacterium]|nr:hypothetical protein [Candidatus Paceibacterota bacterium]
MYQWEYWDLLTMKWCIYFGCVGYLGYLGFKHHDRALREYELNLFELQSLHGLFIDAEVFGPAEQIDKEIISYLNANNDWAFWGEDPDPEPV